MDVWIWEGMKLCEVFRPRRIPNLPMKRSSTRITTFACFRPSAISPPNFRAITRAAASSRTLCPGNVGKQQLALSGGRLAELWFPCESVERVQDLSHERLIGILAVPPGNGDVGLDP